MLLIIYVHTTEITPAKVTINICTLDYNSGSGHSYLQTSLSTFYVGHMGEFTG